MYMTRTAEHERVGRIVIGILKGFQNLEALKNFLISKGLSTTLVIPFGANEVAMEFPDKDSMMGFLAK